MAEGTRTGLTPPPTVYFAPREYAAATVVTRGTGPATSTAVVTTNRVKNIRVGNVPA